ncbi:efflux RND transporter permease subunit [Pendulispora rubella]|uniref:Efflux RND transporter permease subunit n=1 Tax=Pendulispora rubella TaxID=2741070 RepID=A0ABZ2LD07_9BACT
MRIRWVLVGASVAGLFGVVFAFAGSGAEFVPRIFEGDAILAMLRAPSVSLEEARRLDLLAEKVVLGFPETQKALGQSGRAEMALDAVGNNNTDILVPLKPMKQWQSVHSFEELASTLKDRVESQVPSTFVSVSQPIEDLTNQLIAGSRADVSIKIIGPELNELVDFSTASAMSFGTFRARATSRSSASWGSRPSPPPRIDRAWLATASK